MKQRYVDAVCREMNLRAGEIEEAPTTIYIGGGTPSQLAPEQLRQLFTAIEQLWGTTSPDTEITMECNPDDVTDDFATLLEQLPVNRVSMGVQTFNDTRLRFLHRRHTAFQIRGAVDRLRRAGIDNVSIDLMFGFPGETIDEWRNDIDRALNLEVEHISAYSLMYEEGTPLYAMLQRGEISEISEEVSLEMYDMLIDKLTAAGYEHYEISNFALPHRRSRHNSSYWHDTPYVGLGAAAHSYNRASRSWNISSVAQYVESLENGKRPFESEPIDEDTHYDDIVTTALRTREGICLDNLSPRHRDFLLKAARPHIADGTLALDGKQLHLTRKGIFISDAIMADLMCVE